MALPGIVGHNYVMKAVVAIGGNSLIKDARHQSVEDQEAALRETAGHLADMIGDGWDLAIGHGNGPQVGFITRRSEIAHEVAGMHEIPLDVCGADTQGAIGYELQQALQNELFHRGIKKNVATLITQVLTDRNDPAFANPQKPIGGFFPREEIEETGHNRGWSITEDAGRGWRRVVPSPLPAEIVELDSVKALLDIGVVVITVGGGGIPVVDIGEGEYRGIDAVIDKDYSASLLAKEIGADLFLIATSVDRIALNFGGPDERWIDTISLEELKAYFNQGTHFAKGSMAPKIQAILWYLDAVDGEAIITSPANIGAALRRKAGTIIRR